MRHDQKAAIDLILSAGGEFIRQTKHGLLYRLPNGKTIAFSRSTSDWRAVRNLQSELRRKLSAS